MIIYHYDDQNIYAGSSQAQADPLEPEKFLLPRQAVEIAPPDCGQNETPVWTGQGWEIQPDFRGLLGYKTDSGAERKISQVGPWPDDLAAEPKPGPAYEWESQSGQWVYRLELDSPGPDYRFMDGAWIRTRFSRKDFLLFCGLEKVMGLNAAINSGNIVAQTVHDLLFAAEYIEVSDPDTARMLGLLASEAGGNLFSAEEIAAILKGKPYVDPVKE